MKAALFPRAGLRRREAAWGKCDRELCSFGGKAGKSVVSFLSDVSLSSPAHFSVRLLSP